MIPKSIRWRIQLWLAFLLVCILSGFGITAYQLHRTNQFRQMDEELERRVAALGSDVRRPPFAPMPGRAPFELERMTNRGGLDLGPPRGRMPQDQDFDLPPPRRPGPEPKGRRGGMEDRREFRDFRELRLSVPTLNLFDESQTNGFYYGIWSRGGNLMKRSTNAPAVLAFPERWALDARIHLRTHADHREAFQFTEFGECILAGRFIGADLTALQRFAWLLVGAGAAILTLGLGGGWVLASRALRPVEHISAAAGRISAGQLSERIDLADTDSELGRLAGVLNSTFARLEAAFAQQKQFTTDASHELRTPLAVMISEAQTTLARERNAAEYRETIEVCLDAAQQMKRLTQSLLELARYDAGQETIEQQPVHLAECVASCIERIEPLARQRGIIIHRDLKPVTVPGDADRLAQVITNLLANAIQYNKDAGEIRVATRADSGTALLTVADTGQGISEADMPHVFERFYRADKARARSQGHCGLGLAICKAIVDAHGGNLEVSSQLGTGTTFTVRLPE